MASRETLRGRPTGVQNIYGSDRQSHEAIVSRGSGERRSYSASAQPVEEATGSKVSLGIFSNPEDVADDVQDRRKSWMGSPKRLLEKVKSRRSWGVNSPERVRARALKAKANETNKEETS